MCGIAGIVAIGPSALPPEREALRAMAAAMYHRGPDEFGIYRDARAGFAHTRLSIVDLKSGQQPLANADETLWLVFNGEIFNYVELRAELVAAGYRFRTQSDTEVIVHAYEHWGDAAFERMNGQWAVALWDERKRKLVLSRDRLGVRPLYIAEHAGRVYFASEVKALFAGEPSLERALDPVGIEETLTFWSVVPPQSVFRGIEELSPGHTRTYDELGKREQAFWTPCYPEQPERSYEFRGSLDDAVAEVRRAIESATELRMVRADVPVGSYLSGGIDSSLIAAMGRRFAGDHFHTFSVRFADAEYDETGFQQMMVALLGSDHHEIVVSRKDIADIIPEVVFHAERPILRTAPAPLFLLSRLVRDTGIKVVLTGEGADEMFAGYDLFREGKVRRFWAKHPESTLRPRVLERLYPYLARSPVAQRAMARQFFGRNLERAALPGFAHEPRWQSTSALKRMLDPGFRERAASVDVVQRFMATLPDAIERWHPLAQDQAIEIKTLLAGYLLSSQGDRMLMANSVEGRFPFLDKNVVALASSLPAAYKLKVLDEKHVLKRVARDVIPKEIVARKKQPYRAPDALAFTGPHMPDYVSEMFDLRALKDAGVFAPEAVAKLWQKCRGRDDDSQFSNADNMALVGVLSTQLLHHQYIRQRPQTDREIFVRTDIDHTKRAAGGTS